MCTEMVASASSLRCADVLHALLSHSGIGTATARAVRAMRCSQMPCSGSGVDASRSGIASTDSDGS